LQTWHAHLNSLPCAFLKTTHKRAFELVFTLLPVKFSTRSNEQVTKRGKSLLTMYESLLSVEEI